MPNLKKQYASWSKAGVKIIELNDLKGGYLIFIWYWKYGWGDRYSLCFWWNFWLCLILIWLLRGLRWITGFGSKNKIIVHKLIYIQKLRVSSSLYIYSFTIILEILRKFNCSFCILSTPKIIMLNGSYQDRLKDIFLFYNFYFGNND